MNQSTHAACNILCAQNDKNKCKYIDKNPTMEHLVQGVKKCFVVASIGEHYILRSTKIC